jgi:hypothetical protein
MKISVQLLDARDRIGSARPVRRFQAAAVLALGLLLLVTAPGCNSGSSSGSSAPPPAALKVTRATPVAGATGVAAGAPVEVEFSADVDFSTVGTSSFDVQGSVSGKVQGAYSQKSAREVAFEPSSDFTKGEQVRVRLTKAIRSAEGGALEPMTFSFRVEDSAPPPVPIEVEASTPAPHATDVPRSQTVTIDLSGAVDTATLSAATAWLSSPAGGRIPAAVQAANGNRRIALLPEDDLPAGTLVTVHLSSSLRAATGGAFAGEVFQFRTTAAPPPEERKLDTAFSALGPVAILLAGDINLDGRADAVYAAENETVFDILLGRGDGTFLPAVRTDADRRVLALHLADLDSDGDLDVLAGLDDRIALYHNRSVEDGPLPASVRLEKGPETPTGAAVRAAAAGDLDHAGAIDLVLDTDRGILVFLGGAAAQPSQVLGGQRLSRTDISLADMDLDGHLDLVFGDRRGPKLTYYLADPSGNGRFDEATEVALGVEADQVAVENLGGDAFPEVVVLAAASASEGGKAFRLVRRTSTGYQVDGGAAGNGEAPDTLDAGRFGLGDLDGDGRVDILLASVELGTVVWFPNVDGTFDFSGAGSPAAAIPGALHVAAPDLTGDGSLDILAAGGREIHTLLPGEEEPPPQGTFEVFIEPIDVRQGDPDANALIKLTNTEPLQGYSMALGFEALAILPKSVNIEGTPTAVHGAEFSAFRVLEEESAVSYSVLMDFIPPIEGKVLPAGTNQLLFRLVFDVKPTAPLRESELRFLEAAGTPPVATAVVVSGESVRPVTRPGTITILPPKEPPPTEENRMRLSSADVSPGAEGSLVLLGSSDKPIEAFTAIVGYDPAVIEVLAFDLAGSVTEPLAPELIVPSIRQNEGYAIFTVLFDLLPPFERQTIAPGEEQNFFTVRFRVKDTVVPGAYPVWLQNGVSDPVLNNIFVVEGQSIFPQLLPGEIRVADTTEPTFIRGDYNGSGTVDLTDSVAIVNFLFRSGTPPECRDAADADDRGTIDITDSIFLLNFLFHGGSPPPPPHPEPGPDPTPDSLECEE